MTEVRGNFRSYSIFYQFRWEITRKKHPPKNLNEKRITIAEIEEKLGIIKYARYFQLTINQPSLYSHEIELRSKTKMRIVMQEIVFLSFVTNDVINRVILSRKVF